MMVVMIGCIVSCSYGNNSMVLSICFSRVRVLLIGPYLCLLFRMCNTYASWGSLCFMRLVCSWYLCFKLWLVCPMYDVTCKFIDSALVVFLYIVVYFWLCELL